jgi:hypothetical protein
MNTQYRCQTPLRRQKVIERKTLNGIDYLEIASTDQKTLDLFFLHPLPGEADEIPAAPHNVPALTKDNFLITGGARIKAPAIERIVSVSGKRLRLMVKECGDYSTYTLRLISSPTQLSVPVGFDPQFAAIDFSFKVLCRSEFDCQQEQVCPPEPLAEPPINYLAKDYASFRRLMLDRLSLIMPEWRERHPSDLQVALVEILAYVGDHLSYYQDAVATEAYLTTARRRISVRRHARLLDYPMHEGCNARTWVCFTLPKDGGTAEGKELAAGTPIITSQSDASTVITDPQEFKKALNENPIVFETLHTITLRTAHNAIDFYTWGDEQCCLPQGATRATLKVEDDQPLLLKKGNVLIFEEVLNPITLREAGANPTKRHAVRLVEVLDTDAAGQPLTDPLLGKKIIEIRWHPEDALPFPLCLSALGEDSSGKPVVRSVSVARGNVVLADHGLTLPAADLPKPVDDIRYRPELTYRGLTVTQPYEPLDPSLLAASKVLEQDPRKALPSVKLTDNHTSPWSVRRDLLGSDRFATDVIVEQEEDGRAFLRFGDDVLGQQPEPGTEFTAICRVGNGQMGNVGSETLTRVFCQFKDIVQVRNPLPARGGTDPETLIEVRQFAPQAFHTQKRAVTEADYAAAAEKHPEVRRAAARFRWTGSWYTVFITIDRALGRPVDEDPVFEEAVRRHLDQFRLAGYDLEIQGPVFVPLELAFSICIAPGYFRATVEEMLLEEFSNRDLRNGRRGFFHPDNFTFAQPVFVSQLCERALSVAGVAVVAVTTFQRYGWPADNELKRGYLEPADLEIVRLDNDKNFPENGKLTFNLDGGL